MKAMILAAGRGERMRPLTDSCPKPLIKVAGKPLIEHHIRKLVAVGVTDIVINLAWLGEQIEDYLQDGKWLGANIQYSWERDGALETAGGIKQALSLLSNEEQQPFLVINGDIFCNYGFNDLPHLNSDKLVHLFLVKNPTHNQKGDFCISADLIKNPCEHESLSTFTFSGIGIYRPIFFSQENIDQKYPLAPLLRKAADKKLISGQVLLEHWTDVGTPERLAQLNNQQMVPE